VSKKTGRAPKFKSKFEEWIWSVAKKYKQPLEYETRRLSYTLSKTYIPDFILPNGIIVEAKGKFDADMRRKMLAVKRCHPTLDIRFVFQNANNKLNKRARMRYWQWAEKHKFKWSESTIPPAWWKEKPNKK